MTSSATDNQHTSTPTASPTIPPVNTDDTAPSSLIQPVLFLEDTIAPIDEPCQSESPGEANEAVSFQVDFDAARAPDITPPEDLHSGEESCRVGNDLSQEDRAPDDADAIMTRPSCESEPGIQTLPMDLSKSVGDDEPLPKQESSSNEVSDATNNVGETLNRHPSGHKRLNIWTWIVAFVTLLMLVPTMVYVIALSMTSGLITKMIPHGPTRPVTLLIVLTELLGILLGAICASTFDVLAWALASSKGGITMSSFLGISPNTGFEGLLHLLLWDGVNHRLWVLIRQDQV